LPKESVGGKPPHKERRVGDSGSPEKQFVKGIGGRGTKEEKNLDSREWSKLGGAVRVGSAPALGECTESERGLSKERHCFGEKKGRAKETQSLRRSIPAYVFKEMSLAVVDGVSLLRWED